MVIIEQLDLPQPYKDKAFVGFINEQAGAWNWIPSSAPHVFPNQTPGELRDALLAVITDNPLLDTPTYHWIRDNYSKDRIYDVYYGLLQRKEKQLLILGKKPLYQFAVVDNQRFLLTDVICALYLLYHRLYRVPEDSLTATLIGRQISQYAGAIQKAFGVLSYADASLNPARLIYNKCLTSRSTGEQTFSRIVAVDREIYSRYLQAGYTEQSLVELVMATDPDRMLTLNRTVD